MPVNYDEVLADLRQMKADAEAGIAAIERLASRTPATAPIAPVTPVVGIPGDQGDASIPQRILRFLEANPGSWRIMNIADNTGVKNIQTLRGALGRLVNAGKVGKHGRGRYRAPRSKTQPESEA